MSWILQRGFQETDSTKADESLLLWGSPAQPVEGVVLSCEEGESPASPEIWELRCGKRRRLPAQQIGPYLSAETLTGELCVWGALPWWQEPDLSAYSPYRQVLYIPWQGWLGGRWFDGPLIECYNGTILSYVACGSPARLTVPTRTSAPRSAICVENLKQGQAWKQSLSRALRFHWVPPPKELVVLTLEKGDAFDAAILTMLRCAYPKLPLFAEQGGRNLEPAWRRLYQNFNIQLRPPPRDRACLRLSLASLWPESERAELLRFLQALEKDIPCIPEHLLRSWSAHSV